VGAPLCWGCIGGKDRAVKRTACVAHPTAPHTPYTPYPHTPYPLHPLPPHPLHPLHPLNPPLTQEQGRAHA
jgi:hypothetical protein